VGMLTITTFAAWWYFDIPKLEVLGSLFGCKHPIDLITRLRLAHDVVI